MVHPHSSTLWHVALPTLIAGVLFTASTRFDAASGPSAAQEELQPAPIVATPPSPVHTWFEEGTLRLEALPTIPADQIDAETLWLARCIYSETKRPHEQELVAWVIRNRVETQYRGKRTYRGVVLDPFQFSAFIPGQWKIDHYGQLKATDNLGPTWESAKAIAFYVRHASAERNPFPSKTRHFYSEQSMVDRSFPAWADGRQPVAPRRDYTVDARRFRFFAGIS
ncbi:MAG: cell wall hydrolase [Bacteroidota bacterium]